MRKVLLFLFNLTFANFGANAQAPVLSDTSPYVYTLGEKISPLSLNNTGGSIPTSVYSGTTTIAGNGTYGSANGTGSQASFNGVSGVAIDKTGNVFVADFGNNLIRKISRTGEVVTFAGNGINASVDGIGTAASFNAPYGLAVDKDGNIYVADSESSKIRKISPAGLVTTFAGSGDLGSVDGIGIAASFDHPYGLAVDNAGNVYVADTGNNKIRKITPSGVVTTLAGNGISGSNDGRGTTSSFNLPFGLTVSVSGDVYVADSGNNRVRKINSAGEVITVAGSGIEGGADGLAAAATFKFPFGLVSDVLGNVYVSDSFNNKIRKISPAGMVTTISGNGSSNAADGTDTNAGFNQPTGITIDGSGNIYVADYLNNKIRKISIFGYTIYPALPAGLSLDAATGIISGTPAVVTQASDYVVTATNAIGSASANLNITIKQTGLNRLAMQDLSVYPNPAGAVLNIKTSENMILQNLQVLDVYGKVILETGNASQIDVQSLKSGVYIINAQTQEKSYQMKFVKS